MGRSFLAADEGLWFEIRRILESLRSVGFLFEDAQEAQARPISEKVRQGITRNDIYIGILSRRLPIGIESSEESILKRLAKALRTHFEECQWTTSEWVIQESGFALGLGRRVILMIERGVAFPVADLDADTEWIPFDRNSLADCSLRLVQMISNLIAARLPVPVTPAATAPTAQGSTVREMDQKAASSIDELSQIDTLLAEKRFEQADELFESYMKSDQVKDPQASSAVYFKYKCLLGDRSGLEKLASALKADPGHVYARQALASCYEHFRAYNQAAEILLEGATEAAAESKARFLRRAAEKLAKDGKHDQAFMILGGLLQTVTDPKGRHPLFLSLADVAHLKGDQALEVAMLEQVLELNPSDAEVRFRAAYLYSEMKKERLAVYHYGLRVSQDQDPLAKNNLGVALDALELKGKAIEMYEAASDRNELAKANLSHAYVDRGFLKSAEDLALSVERSDADAYARQRATAALQRVADLRRREDESEERILEGVKRERLFMAKYATAFVSPLGKPVVGTFSTPLGQLSFEQQIGTMEEENIAGARAVPSYLIECLAWNVPNEGFNRSTYTADVRWALAHLFNETRAIESCKEWGEINELKYLFGGHQPWTLGQAHAFASAAWDYLGFE